jgi:glutathione S-transferase
MQRIILYDIPCKLPKKQWAPNPSKTRFCLGHKNLPYEVIWVDFGDIAATMKGIGASPTAGQRYTVPVIKDPNTGAVVSDSHAIAKYLDKTYPDKPLIPHGTHVLIETFETLFLNTVTAPSFKLLMARTLEIQSDINREGFIKSRLKMSKQTRWEDMAPEGKAQEMWAALKRGLGVVDGWYQKSGGRWIMGDTFSFADIVVASWTGAWWNAILNEQERQEVHALHGGRWARLLADVNAQCNTDLGSFEKRSRSFL